MNSESNPKIQRTQSSKSVSYKRAHRAHRPTLVTEATEPTLAGVEETSQPVQTAVEELPEVQEQAPRKRRPGFFASITRTEKSEDQPVADPKAARMARAMRGKTASSTSGETAQEKKPVASKPQKSSVPARPRSGFKTRYIWGMMAYLLIADFLGIYLTNFMRAQGWDALVFQVGAFQASRSTLVFLALLVVILIVMARFDLIPRTFRSLGGDPAPRGSSSSPKKDAPTFETRKPQPTMKQGVKGTDDALYQEYRANQRYFQKRDRKR